MSFLAFKNSYPFKDIFEFNKFKNSKFHSINLGKTLSNTELQGKYRYDVSKTI